MNNDNNTVLATLPNSLREQMERAQNLFQQSEHAGLHGNQSLAIQKATEAMQVVGRLAQHTPELATLLLAADMGYRGYEIETIERVDRYQVVQRSFLGFPTGQEVVNVPTITRKVVRGRMI